MGSINIRKRGNVYQYSFEIASIDGKRKQKTKSGFKTKAEAQKEGTIAYNDYITTGVAFIESEISYSDYLDYWIKNYCEPNLRYNTIEKYRILIKKYIKPFLGQYRLSSISSVKLTTYINELCEKYDFSRAYFRSILKVLKGSFRDAVNIYGFIRINPALTIRLPKLIKENEEPKHLYSQNEIEMILDRFKDDDVFTCAFLTGCYTGMRTGEIFALTWDDIDLENRIINIKHNVYEKQKDEKGRWYIGTTKTTTGIRTIYICPTLYTVLINYKKKKELSKSLYGSKYKYYQLESVRNEYGKEQEYRIVESKNNSGNCLDLVFTKHDGKYTGKDVIKYPYTVIHKELGIKNCRFYDLRGSYATNILRSGAELKDVADLLGHKNIETTENYYIRATNNGKEHANKLIEKNLEPEVIAKYIRFAYN